LKTTNYLLIEIQQTSTSKNIKDIVSFCLEKYIFPLSQLGSFQSTFTSISVIDYSLHELLPHVACVITFMAYCGPTSL
jgi:hypothetical protein